MDPIVLSTNNKVYQQVITISPSHSQAILYNVNVRYIYWSQKGKLSRYCNLRERPKCDRRDEGTYVLLEKETLVHNTSVNPPFLFRQYLLPFIEKERCYDGYSERKERERERGGKRGRGGGGRGERERKRDGRGREERKRGMERKRGRGEREREREREEKEDGNKEWRKREWEKMGVNIHELEIILKRQHKRLSLNLNIVLVNDSKHNHSKHNLGKICLKCQHITMIPTFKFCITLLFFSP